MKAKTEGMYVNKISQMDDTLQLQQGLSNHSATKDLAF